MNLQSFKRCASASPAHKLLSGGKVLQCSLLPRTHKSRLSGLRITFPRCTGKRKQPSSQAAQLQAPTTLQLKPGQAKASTHTTVNSDAVCFVPFPPFIPSIYINRLKIHHLQQSWFPSASMNHIHLNWPLRIHTPDFSTYSCAA